MATREARLTRHTQGTLALINPTNKKTDMIQKKLTKLVGLKKTDFDLFVQNGQIKLQRANLIPTLKTGDEMALTSIFLSTVKLVKEYRDGIFKSIKLKLLKNYFQNEKKILKKTKDKPITLYKEQ